MPTEWSNIETSPRQHRLLPTHRKSLRQPATHSVSLRETALPSRESRCHLGQSITASVPQSRNTKGATKRVFLRGFARRSYPRTPTGFISSPSDEEGVLSLFCSTVLPANADRIHLLPHRRRGCSGSVLLDGPTRERRQDSTPPPATKARQGGCSVAVLLDGPTRERRQDSSPPPATKERN